MNPLAYMLRGLTWVCVALAVIVGAVAITTPSDAAPVASVQATARVDTCANDAPNEWNEFNDSYYCLGPQKHWQAPVVSYLGICYNLNLITDAAHPAPNGWSNVMSSVVNNDKHREYFYDAFNCGGSPLFMLQPHTFNDRLPTGVNNRPSSIKVFCVQPDCQ